MHLMDHGGLETPTREFPTIRGPNMDPKSRALVIKSPTKRTLQFTEAGTWESATDDVNLHP